MSDPHAEYQILMDEYRPIWEERQAAFSVIVRRQADIAAGRSVQNPTPEEEERLEAAERALEGINIRINRFMEENNGFSR